MTTTTVVEAKTRKEQEAFIAQFVAAHVGEGVSVSRPLVTEVAVRTQPYWKPFVDGGEKVEGQTLIVRYVGPKDWEDPIDRIMKRKRARRGYRR